MKTNVLFAVLAFALSSCGKVPASPPLTARPAMTEIVGQYADPDSHVYSGDIRARHEITLGFRVSGELSQRHVDVGAVVKAGQVLARLDPGDEGLQSSAADAQYQLAKVDLERYRVLRSKNFVSQSALDAKEAAFKAMSAQAGLARNQTAYTSLVAEKSGVVTATLAEDGQVVGAGQPVIRIAQTGDREVSVDIPESEFSRIKVGMQADVTLWDQGERTNHQTGKVREITPAADPVSRTYAIRITLPDTSVPLGMTAQVRFAGSEDAHPQLIVPLSAVFQLGNETALWVVSNDHHVSLRDVKITEYRDEGAVIGSGVTIGERIVTNGVHILHAGEQIQPIEPGMAR